MMQMRQSQAKRTVWQCGTKTCICHWRSAPFKGGESRGRSASAPDLSREALACAFRGEPGYYYIPDACNPLASERASGRMSARFPIGSVALAVVLSTAFLLSCATWPPLLYAIAPLFSYLDYHRQFCTISQMANLIFIFKKLIIYQYSYLIFRGKYCLLYMVVVHSNA